MDRKSQYNLLMVSVLISCIYIFLLSPSFVSAESRSATASVTVPEACTMTSINNTPHTATLSPNTYSGASGSGYENGIGKTTLTATCNDDNGFAIYAIGYTGNSYDSENHNKLVGSNTGGAISTKTYTSGDTISSWSMKLTKVTNTSESYNPENLTITNSYNDWNIIPATYTKVAQYKASTGSSTTDTTLGVKLETTYAAYIAPNQPADTYIGQVKYTMVHPYDNTAKDGPIVDCPANKICYSPNANDIEGTMGQQSIISSTTSTTLLASNFSRKGYGFAGWSDRYDYSNDNGAKFYGPQETISFTAGQYSNTNGGLRLYAIWIPSQGSLQDSTKVTQLCGTNGTGGSLVTTPTDSTANLDSVSALTDQRDHETYAIARLADGKCWMIENLRLESKYTRGETNKTLAQGYGVSITYGNFEGLADPESTSFNSATANSLYYFNNQSNTASIDIGTSNSPIYRMPRYNNIHTSSRASNPTSNNTSMYSYGNYYTWAAAMANTANYNSTTGSSGSESANTSICPTNWNLPTSGTATKDFGILSQSYGGTGSNQSGSADAGTIMSNRFRAFPNNFLYSGSFSGSSTSNYGRDGRYWSKSAYTANNSYYLSLSYSFLYPSGASGNTKSFGYGVRCLIGV